MRVVVKTSLVEVLTQLEMAVAGTSRLVVELISLEMEACTLLPMVENYLLLVCVVVVAFLEVELISPEMEERTPREMVESSLVLVTVVVLTPQMVGMSSPEYVMVGTSLPEVERSPVLAFVETLSLVVVETFQVVVVN